MKKLVATTVIATILLATGAAFGQSDAHDVEVLIPNVLMLRITDASGSDEGASPSVVFDFQTDVDAYLDMVNGGGGDLAPTGVADFDDVIVFSNRAAWSVGVSAEALTFADDLGLSVSGNGVALSDISVEPSGTPGPNVSSVETSWSLATTDSIANGVRTQGWRSLGFGGSDYRLAVNGDEDPGSYTTVVTYTITAP